MVDLSRFVPTRTPNNITTIVLHEVTSDLDLLLAQMEDCLDVRNCGDSYHGYYALDSGFTEFLTPEKQSLTFLPLPPAVPSTCPELDDPCCHFPSDKVNYQAGLDANVYTYNIAVKVSKPSLIVGECKTLCSPADYQGLVSAIAQAYAKIKAAYPAFVLTVNSLISGSSPCCPKQLSCIQDWQQLVDDVLAVVALPPVIVNNPVCRAIQNLPTGVVVTVAGIDAAGNCVRGNNLGLDIFMVSGVYDAGTDTLNYTMSDGSIVPVDVSGLIADILAAVPADVSTISATYNLGTQVATFTKSDGSTYTLNLSTIPRVNFALSAAPTTATSPIHPDLHYGTNSSYLGTPTGWVNLLDEAGTVIAKVPSYL